MKSIIWKSLIGVVLLSVLALAVSFTAARSLKTNEGASGAESLSNQPASESGLTELERLKEGQVKKLEGTWRVQITIRDCQTGAILGNPFPALVTFGRGGTLASSDTRFSPALRSPGHGVWHNTGGHTYSALTEAFLFSSAGAWIGTQRITQAIEIGEDPNELNASALTQFIDPNGNPIPGFPPFTVCSTTVGHRLE